MVTLSEAKEMDDLNRTKADAVMRRIDELNNSIMEAVRAGLTVEFEVVDTPLESTVMPLLTGSVYLTIRYS